MSNVSVPSEELPPVTTLSRTQRRVLGVLVEKGITTPEYYPLTLKALTTGCNQKNNRMPLTEFSEEDVERAVDQLRELGLAAVVHTESGRSERYRHYVRKRFPFNEAQLAIVTELWLRGRQTLGDLRARASRMQSIETLEQLRDELRTLIAGGFVQSNGPLEARGVEVDHNFYKPEENKSLASSSVTSSPQSNPLLETDGERSGLFRVNSSLSLGGGFERPVSESPSFSSPKTDSLRQLQTEVARLTEANSELEARVTALQATLSELADRFESLRRELGAT